MSTTNDIINTIETDSALFDILTNFSDDYIDNITRESLEMKFRPFNNKLPNYPYILERNFQAIIDHYTGDNIEMIKEKRLDTFNRIISVICEYYNLSIVNPIPDESIYSVTFWLNQIFVVEFTERMINFYTNYIMRNVSAFINVIPEEKRTPRTNYAKNIFNDKDKVDYIILYENINYVFNAMASMDIPFENLVTELSDESVSRFITSFITEIRDCYKNKFAVYLVDENYKTTMTAAIQLNLMKIVLGSNSILDPENNPFIVESEYN